MNINPEYVGAWISLGLVAQKSGDFGLAIQAYSHALKIEPSGFGYVLLAQALEHNGQKSEARSGHSTGKKRVRQFRRCPARGQSPARPIASLSIRVGQTRTAYAKESGPR